MEQQTIIRRAKFQNDEMEKYADMLNPEKAREIMKGKKKFEHSLFETYHYMNRRECYKHFEEGQSPYGAECLTGLPHATVNGYWHDYIEEFRKEEKK